MTSTIRVAFLAMLLMLLTGVANADPLTSCVANLQGIGFTCDVHQVKADSTFSQISDIFELPSFVTAGYIVLTADAFNPGDTTQWQDVVRFIDNGAGNNSSIQLFTIGCNTANPGDQSCLPTYSTVLSAPTSDFVSFSGTPSPYVYQAGYNTYNIYATAYIPLPVDGGDGGNGDPNPGSTPVTEPGGLVLFGSGLLAVGAYFRRKRRAS